MIKEYETNKSFNEVVSIVEDICKENKFGVLKTYEFHELLKEKGFPIEKRITVFEICNPAFAQQVISEEAEVSNFMPCKITVIEENGNAKVSTLDINELVKNFKSQKVKDIAKEVQNIINSIIEKITK